MIGDIERGLVENLRVGPLPALDLPHSEPEHLDLHVRGHQGLIPLGGQTDGPDSVTGVTSVSDDHVESRQT